MKMQGAEIVSVKNSEHYTWGENNDGWHLLKNDALSVIEERMHPGTSEQSHFHNKAQQLFYILSGVAGFEIDKQLVEAGAGETVHISAGIPHKIFNKSDTDLRFIVISAPKSHGDRIEV